MTSLRHHLFAFLWLVAFAHSPLATLADDGQFERQTIDGEIQIGYGLAIGRVNNDELPDILLADKKEIVWYENPGEPGEWPKHVIARNLTQRDNVCLAARDIDGDGLVEIAVGANWNPGDTNNTELSGTSFYLQRPEDPTNPWSPVPVEPHEPTTHRMHWVKCTDGELRLAVLPLHGVGNKGGAGKTVMVSLFEIEDGKPRLWKKIDTGLHATHNFDLISEPRAGDHEIMLVAGAEGYRAMFSSGEVHAIVGKPNSKGAGEVRRVPVEKRVFIGIEPMHGTDLAIYRRAGDDWDKEVIDSTLSQGHALATGDLFGDSTPEIVAGWRGQDAQKRVGIKVYSKDGRGWKTQLVDDNQIACEDLKLADLDGNGKLDIIAAGRATKNVVVYWNQ